MSTINNNDFVADKPASLEVEDKFQRYNFARRIAETIIQNQNNDGIVIGIYGAWGDGKTSVINFIGTELSKNATIIRVNFNPWRYSDENTLLISYFHKIAKALNIKLLKKKERIGRWLNKNSDVMSCDLPKIGDISKIANTLGNWLGAIDLEELKNRLDDIIIKSRKKLVIFIDDIDRLDKDEIYSVFRLVKLTADFTNTTYILAFDEQVVSAAIGDRFGSGDSKSGRGFLEKIIQVPLHLPRAQSDALRDYCFERINHIIRTDDINLPDEEGRRFVSLFTTHLLNRLNTPRMVVRYSNSLSFALPLLKNEANLTDLMLIEAIKIIYPGIYSFIKENPDYFIGSYHNSLGRNDEEKKNNAKKEIDKLCDQYSEKEKSSILELLQKIFPLLENIYKNITFANSKIENWYKNKRIASTKYFNRYFTYSVIKGELSDVSFNQFICDLSDLSEDELADKIKLLIKESSTENLIYKLRSIEDKFEWKSAKKLMNILSTRPELFPAFNPQKYFFQSESPIGQSGILIYQLIKHHSTLDEQISYTKELIGKAVPLEFAFDILRWLNPDEKETNNIFTKEQFTEVWSTLLERILRDAGDNDIFDAYPNESYMICKFWEGFGKEEFNQYMHEIIDENTQKAITLLRTCLPRFRSMGEDKYRDGDLDEKTYRYLISILDKDYLMQSIEKIYPKATLETTDVKWKEREDLDLSDFDMVRQFYHWYSTEISGK